MKSVIRKVLLFFVLLILLEIAFLTAASAKAKPLSCVRRVNKKAVCLTIDDGWNKKTVLKVLKILREHKVRCTFFIPGSRLKAFPGVWRQAVKDGHEICYHSMDHKSVRRKSSGKIIADIREWEKTAHKALGADYAIPKFARLPGGSGSRDQRVLKAYASRGYRVVYWTAETLAHRKHVVSYIKKKTKPGMIILIHFNGYDSRALPKYIDWLKKNFRLLKLSEALPSAGSQA